MTAVFNCDCGHGWNSIRSLNLPENCSQCRQRCNSVDYRPSTRPEQIAGKQVHVYMYVCVPTIIIICFTLVHNGG